MQIARSKSCRRRSIATSCRPLRLRLVILVLVAAAGLASATIAGGSRSIVYVIPIDGVIDLGLAPYMERTLTEAAAHQAAAVVLDINTLGGRVDAAVVIRDALLRTPVRTIAFVNKRAISAGAIIALATT
jgi:membrane-bound serine protease (ClpP class)